MPQELRHHREHLMQFDHTIKGSSSSRYWKLQFPQVFSMDDITSLHLYAPSPMSHVHIPATLRLQSIYFTAFVISSSLTDMFRLSPRPLPLFLSCLQVCFFCVRSALNLFWLQGHNPQASKPEAAFCKLVDP